MVARDSDKLIEATRFHFEMRGFPDEAAARARGNRLRVHLQVLNAVLGLGLVIPTEDTTSGGVSAEIKKKIADEQGVTTLDTIVGSAVFPDDGKHGEFVFAGKLDTYPSDPEYVLNALTTLWPTELKLADHQRDALEIVGRATSEVSPRTRFLLSYLALKRMVKRESRSEAAQKLLQTLIEQANDALSESDAGSLAGALGALSVHSFPRALRLLVQNRSGPRFRGNVLSTLRVLQQHFDAKAVIHALAAPARHCSLRVDMNAPCAMRCSQLRPLSWTLAIA